MTWRAIVDRKSVGTYEYRDALHPNAVTAAGPHSYVYDGTGRLQQRDGFAVQFDPLDRLRSVNGRTGQATFSYSAEGELAMRTTSTGTQLFHGNLVEVDASGALSFNYLMGDQVFAQRRPGGRVVFLHRDRLGSVREITDQVGAVAELYSYTAWGASAGQQGLPNDQRFAGGREDSDTGLVQLGSRALDPVLARLTSPDKIVPNAYKPVYLNRYVYARNNPVNVIDPSGFAPPDEENSIVAQVIAHLRSALDPLQKGKWILNPLTPKQSTLPRDGLDDLLDVLRGELRRTSRSCTSSS